jgi:peptidoglycan hydrolase-like protein with peptidoglycan-binding domain
MNGSEIMETLDQMFRREEARGDLPAKARELYDGWREWYDGLGWYDRTMARDVQASAKRRAGAFMTALGQKGKDPLALPVIGKGTRGPVVRKLQELLGIKADGNFEAKTEAALRAWQTANQIEATGRTTAETWDKLGAVAVTAPLPARVESGEEAQSAFGVEQMQQSFFSVGQGDYVKASYGNPITVGPGSKGQQVAAWQTIIGVKADGVFGPLTTAATKKWQSAHGLTPDGIAGPASWAAASKVTPAAVVTVLQTELAKEKPFNVDLGNADMPGFAPPPVVQAAKAAAQFKPSVKLAPIPQEAGIFSGLSKLSTPAKVALGVGAAAAIVYGVNEEMKKGKR